MNLTTTFPNVSKLIGLQSCDNCRKRWEPTCLVYKQENKRPKDSDWCQGWRKQPERRLLQAAEAAGTEERGET
jgi:hypothetical protein